ncbi:MAG: hypothetical protein ABFS09_02445 [Thermodesulfobacteriota bacterium]
MADPIERRIEQRLLAGQRKADIWQDMKNDAEPEKALFYLNNKASLKDRLNFQIVNLVLALILAFVTAKELITLFSFGKLDVAFLAGLVVPIINIYILKEILRFHRLGYQYLFVLSTLSLILPKNHGTLELSLTLLMIATSGFLHMKLFPKKRAIS